MLFETTTINCNGQILDISQPIVMGIINVTDDSFYKESRNHDEKNILTTAEKHLQDGAKIIDIGAMSTRPGAHEIDLNEEIDRIASTIQLLKNHFKNIIISVDTYRSSVAEMALSFGADMINDISAGKLGDNMINVISKYNVPYIIMHMVGTPATMSKNTDYPDLMSSMLDYFVEAIGNLRQAGVKDIILDPGFGFSKTLDQNYELLSKIHLLQIFELPILVGLSRKSMIYKVLGSTSEYALNGTTAAHMLALQQGAKILRVHDVKEATEAIKIYNLYKKNNINKNSFY